MMASPNHKVEVKIEKLCRTCLSKENELNSLFDVMLGTLTLDYIVTAITGLKINKGDGLPSTICTDCKEKAEKAYEFKKKSQEAHISLRGFYKHDFKVLVDHTKTTEQNSERVKTEKSKVNDHDGFSDAEYDFELSNSPEVNTVQVEVIKNETQENVIYGECKKCCLIFDSEDKLVEHNKQNKCVKVECEYGDVSGTYCPICGTYYDGDKSLSKHMWEYHANLMGTKKRGRPKKIMTTTLLNKLSENGLLISSSHGKTYKCSFCKMQAKSKKDLSMHMQQHKDAKLLCCTLCKKVYMKKKNFNSHLCILNTSADNEITKKTDKKDLASTMLLQELFDPNVDMTASVVQMCSACSGVFLSEGDLINHHDTDHPELSLRCNHCSKIFASVKTAARHRLACKEIERMHKCTTCGLKFAYEISLNKHILRYHRGQSVSVAFLERKPRTTGDVQYQCDTCNKIFHRKEALMKHTKLHMPNQKVFECDICQRKFNRSDNLRTHKKIHDVDRVKPQSNNCLCLYCGRGFSNSSNLIVHMRRHTGEKPYKCDFCGKGFPRSSDLMVHRRSHTGEKPCVCRVCGKAFSRSNKLTRHMRVHTGQRPYKCTYCEKAFSQSNDLTLHIRRHTGDKPYVCEACGERFIQGTALQNHRRIHGHFPPPTSDLALQIPNNVVNSYPVPNLSTLALPLENHIMPN